MSTHIVLQKGFRPFFLLGGLAAVGLIPWWAINYDQPMSGEPGLESISWHSHEMLFGFTMAIIAGVSGILVITRSLHWGTMKTFGQPLLWILHIGHAWIGAGLLLKAVSAASLGVPPSVATHALTAGAIGTLTLGMMARVTLGHTGRPLEASHFMTVGFVAITASAGLRVIGPWLRVDLTKTLLIASGFYWALAFAIYLAVNIKALLPPRPDGKPG